MCHNDSNNKINNKMHNNINFEDPNFISIVYRESCSELEMETHFHNSYEIIYVVEGKAQFHINNKAYNITPGNIIFINNLESHHLKVISYPYKRYFILIDPLWFQSVINDPILLSLFKNRPWHFRHTICLDTAIRDVITELFTKMFAEFKDKKDYWILAIESYLQKLLVLLYRNYRGIFPLVSYTKPMETIFQVQKHIEENCTGEISLETVSKLFYIDKYYLSRLFRETTGFTFKEYLILQRISRAKERLFYTNNSITKVGIDSGFNNVNHFIRIFKKYTGTTPLKYRLTYRNNKFY
ncbi:MAG: helix-turn-helix transcriptional regulator [Firmicutes bacterium]|nr:helix-turn-helix transcriptional regulator [Bacillota bacterium]